MALRDKLNTLFQTQSIPELLRVLGQCLGLSGTAFYVERGVASDSKSLDEMARLSDKAHLCLQTHDLWTDLEFSDEPISIELDNETYITFPLRLVDSGQSQTPKLVAAGFKFSETLSALTEEQQVLIDTTRYIAHQISRFDAKEIELERDSVTGLLNSRSLKSRVRAEIARAERFSGQFSLLFIDLDNFKQINDRFGHLAGTSVLSQTAEILKQDSREIDAIIRYGGDEFIILLVGADSVRAKAVAERIRTRIDEARYYLDDGHYLSLTASIGVASYPEHRKSVDDLIRLADEMMYTGKKTGKNRVCLLSPSL